MGGAYRKVVRTALITTGTIGEAKRGEQILALTPNSLLCYKPGFRVRVGVNVG